MDAAVTIKSGNTMLLSPGGSLRLTDLDSLRILATKKGVILRAGDNGRSTLKIVWRGGSKKSAKAAKAASKAASKAGAGAGHAKAMAASAKSIAVSADAIAKGAHAAAVPAAAKAAAGVGAGIAFNTLGPVLLLAGMTAVIGGIFVYLHNAPYDEPQPQY